MSQTVYQPPASSSSPSEYNSYQQSSMYIPVSGLYYQTESQPSGMEDIHDGVTTTLDTTSQMLVEQQDGTLLLYVDEDGRTATQPLVEEEGRLGSHIDVKFCKQEMDFLHENYESCEGSSMPRCVIYNQYRRYCRHHLGGITPMNAASFGKLIRLVFAGIKTRRLGTRGNSKYHYYGIRLKPTSVLSQLMQQDVDDGQVRYDDEEDDDDVSDAHAAISSNDNASFIIGPSGITEGPTALQLQHQQFLGDASLVMLDLGSVTIDDNELLPEGITVEHLTVFESMYHSHCQDILEAVKLMQLAAIPELWQQFWNCPLTTDSVVVEDPGYLTGIVMKDLSCIESLQKYVRQADYTFYSILIDILIPDVLRPIPNSLTLVLRNFAKNLDGWIDASLVDVAKGMVDVKVSACKYDRDNKTAVHSAKSAAGAFAQLLRRYTGLNHLAQAARTILQNRTQVNRMCEDLNKVDFVHIQEQGLWVSQCDEVLVYQIQTEIKRIFRNHYTIEQWATWLDDISTYILQERTGQGDFSQTAKRFIMTWSFYSSLVLRDLTLRSAASFGAFHLIRLLFDEYITYTVEHKVAAATGISAIAAFGNNKQFVDYSTVPPLETYMESTNKSVADDYVTRYVSNDMFTLNPSQTIYVDPARQTTGTELQQQQQHHDTT